MKKYTMEGHKRTINTPVYFLTFYSHTHASDFICSAIKFTLICVKIGMEGTFYLLIYFTD